MTALVLDSEALSQLARTRADADLVRVHGAIRAADAAGRCVLVPAAVLAEQYRGGSHDQTADACLARYPGIAVVPTTRELARHVGHLLVCAGKGSEHHVDAVVVAAAIAAGGGVILTSDVGDLRALAAGAVGVVVEPV
jgi:predicted nucleic acid-binding protein